MRNKYRQGQKYFFLSCNTVIPSNIKLIYGKKENIYSPPKQVLSIKIDPHLYQQLKTDIGKGRISRFVEGLIAQELNSQDQKLAQEYQAAAQDKKRWKEAKEWEKAQMVDWNKQDDGEDN